MVCDLFHFVYQQRNLHQFDVSVRWIPVQMCVGEDESCARVDVLEEGDDGDVVLAQDTVEHVVCLLEILTLHGDSAELDEVFFYQLIPSDASCGQRR